MSLTSQRQFIKLYEHQNVTLYPPFSDVRNWDTDNSASWAPLDPAIHCATDVILDDKYAQRLADRRISIPEDSDVGLRTLTAIINSCIEPDTAERGEAHFPEVSKERLDTCTACESEIAWYIRRMNEGNYPAGDVILNDAGDPLLFRKSNGVPNALSFEDIIVGKTRYPAGSIMRVDTRDTYEQGMDGFYHCRYPRVSIEGIRTFTGKDVIRAAFLRLSPFAYEPDQRRRMNSNTIYFRTAAGPDYRRPIGEIRELVAEAVKNNPSPANPALTQPKEKSPVD